MEESLVGEQLPPRANRGSACSASVSSPEEGQERSFSSSLNARRSAAALREFKTAFERFRKSQKTRKPKRNKKLEDMNGKFWRNRKGIANLILENKPVTEAGSLPRRETKEFYRKLWCRDEAFESVALEGGEEFTITREDLVITLRSLDMGGASGFDKISPKTFRSFVASEEGSEVTLKLFNTIGNSGVVPREWRRAKVKLIPKKIGAKVNGDFRPISVHSVVYRVFSSIIDRKLRGYALEAIGSYQQCLSNFNATARSAVLIQSAIANEYMNQRSVFVCSLDIAKAYCSVKHEAILRAMDRAKVPNTLKRLLMNTLKSVRVFECSDGVFSLTTTCGLPQGLAFSTTLFCLVLDTVREPIERSGLICRRGRKLEGETYAEIAGLAFADDLILLDSNKDSLRDRLSMVVEKLALEGLSVNASKSKYFGAIRKRNKAKTYYVDPSGLRTHLGHIKSCDNFVYLGTKISLRTNRFSWESHVKRLCARTHKAKLSMRAKLCLVREHLIPKLNYQLSIHRPYGLGSDRRERGTRLYTKIDQIIRQCVNKIFKMGKASLPIGLHYLPIKMGGLGLKRFSGTIPGERLRLKELFAAGEHSLVSDRWFNDLANVKEELKRNSLAPRSERIRITHEEAAKSLRSLKSGQGAWLPERRTFTAAPITKVKGSDLTNVLRLRGGVMGQKVTEVCRFCENNESERGEVRQRETLRHLLNAGCSKETKAMWIRRHDKTVVEVYGYLKSIAKKRKNVSVGMECNFQLEENVHRKPDLVYVDFETKKCLILDVHIANLMRGKDRATNKVLLEEARKAKRDRYGGMGGTVVKKLLKERRERFGEDRWENFDWSKLRTEVIPLVVSSFGVYYPQANRSVADKCGVSINRLTKFTTERAVVNAGRALRELLALELRSEAIFHM